MSERHHLGTTTQLEIMPQNRISDSESISDSCTAYHGNESEPRRVFTRRTVNASALAEAPCNIDGVGLLSPVVTCEGLFSVVTLPALALRSSQRFIGLQAKVGV
jgi:hypothetical protein